MQDDDIAELEKQYISAAIREAMQADDAERLTELLDPLP